VILWLNQTDRRQTVSDLEPGTRFLCNGVEYDLIYVSGVRARVKQISDIRRPTYINMSPGTVVDKVTLLASQPHIKLVRPDVPVSSTNLLDDHAPAEPKNYQYEREMRRRIDGATRLRNAMLSALGVLFLIIVAGVLVWNFIMFASRHF
jgi:hypothetical protein